jgi:uncharacterized protein (TIGR03435 family)
MKLHNRMTSDFGIQSAKIFAPKRCGQPYLTEEMRFGTMKCTITVVSLAALLAGAALGQSTASQPVFDVADVHVSAPGATDTFGFLRAGRVELKGKTMLNLIMMAYGMNYGGEDEKVVGGPSWLDTDRFDIIAKAAPGSSQEALKAMLQALLADRFKLAIHKDDRPLPVYVLTVGKGLKIKESPAGQTDCKASRENAVITYTCHNMTVAGLAEGVRQRAGAYFDHPLVDQTGLKGEYDFTLRWTPKGQLGMPGAESISVFDALDKQLGLKAEKQMQPAPVIVVDNVNRKPTDNPPGVTEKLPPPPTEFEVADIKPSLPSAKENFDMKNGRIAATAISLKDLITFANDMDDNMVVGGEKWLDTERFDIAAKAAPNTSESELRPMLRTLLEQRFKMKVHKENQPVPVYALTLPKKSPKLKETDGSGRSACKISVDNGLRTYTCQNTTMAQFAEKIRQVATGYLDHPVVDLTGLTGAYDFAVSWTGVGRLRAVPGGGGEAGKPSADAPAAADPTTGLTIFEAVDKQLGLKLAAQKHPMPVLVIDHVERMPTEN